MDQQSKALKVIEKNTIPDPNSGCLLWSGHWVKSKKYPYGRMRYKGKVRGAHTIIYEIHNGPIPDGICVLHTCDTPACCNINHLRAGTHTENMRDMAKKKRSVGPRKFWTHCKRGHEFTEENTFHPKAAPHHRGCLECRKYWNKSRSGRIALGKLR